MTENLEKKDDFNTLYNKYNPIAQYVIRPALRLVDAHNNPIKGGVAAAVSSGIAHYGLLEVILQFSDVTRDPNTKLLIMNAPWVIHFGIGVNMVSNLVIGIIRYCEKLQTKESKV